MATSRGKINKYGWFKDKITWKLVDFTSKLLYFTKLRGLPHFLPQPSNIFTQIYLPYLWHFATLLLLQHFILFILSLIRLLKVTHLSVLGENWVKGSGCIPEDLTQVAPKSGQSLSLLCWWCLRHGIDVDPMCWLVDKTDLGITWVIASGWIPEQLTQVIPKSDK